MQAAATVHSQGPVGSAKHQDEKVRWHHCFFLELVSLVKGEGRQVEKPVKELDDTCRGQNVYANLETHINNKLRIMIKFEVKKNLTKIKMPGHAP